MKNLMATRLNDIVFLAAAVRRVHSEKAACQMLIKKGASFMYRNALQDEINAIKKKQRTPFFTKKNGAASLAKSSLR